MASTGLKTSKLPSNNGMDLFVLSVDIHKYLVSIGLDMDTKIVAYML